MREAKQLFDQAFAEIIDSGLTVDEISNTIWTQI